MHDACSYLPTQQVADVERPQKNAGENDKGAA